MQPGSHAYQAALANLVHILTARGVDAAHAMAQAQAMIYQGMQRQASMLSFVDNFWLMGMICLGVIPLMFLMRKTMPRKTRVAVH